MSENHSNNKLQTQALEISNLTIRFGGLTAVNNLTLNVAEASIHGLIGPNGAGKTTVFNLLTGVYKPTEGRIKLFGKDITGNSPADIARSGLGRTFQNIRLFKELTVEDNLLIALDQNPSNRSPSVWSQIFRTKSAQTNLKQKRDKAIEFLSIFGMESSLFKQASSLPYGDQRKLEIARALATGAKVLLLDEPAAGLNGQETQALMKTIQHLRDQYKVTVLLIEHDMKLVMGVCERISVLDYGTPIAEGSPSEIQREPKVIEAYLGGSSKASPIQKGNLVLA